MDRGLDEIIAETRSSGPRGGRRGGGGGGRHRERHEGPRDGIRKSYRDESRNLDSEWVHDRYDDNSSNSKDARHQLFPYPQRHDLPSSDNAKGTKIRVENIHYDLGQEDIDELFRRIGPVSKIQLRYDRAGRSEGTAYVTYESKEDALDAIRQFDGANANGIHTHTFPLFAKHPITDRTPPGQPIRLTLVSGRSRNPFDTAVMPGRPLSERISAPGNGSRARSYSPPGVRYTQEEAVRKGIDRYIPGQGGGRSRTPPPSRKRGGAGSGGVGGGAGRRPGARRERTEQDSNGGGRRGGNGNNPRPKKTQEELDAEMEDYFAGDGDAAAAAPQKQAPADTSAPAAAPPAGDDVDMIE
ncbi:THO complex subunit 4 [Geosmithia morbida]|uniref:THO complex subunit 4 n=1 Tax=Geosmithia morbida TaxID=1094350 RepID=A0A9P4YXH4_9HYPO|nr:THO complex subunit 4 [Geosmithia morbida]KAF4123536.1 THO complex subunit 4 [Geosmithia morbida]